MEHEINILVVEPGRPPRPAQVGNSLERFSRIIGGELAMGCFLPQRVMLIYNEDASQKKQLLKILDQGLPECHTETAYKNAHCGLQGLSLIHI